MTTSWWERVRPVRFLLWCRRQDLEENEMSSAPLPIPPDDPKRSLTVAQPDNLLHIGLVGDTYTITVTGEQTAGRFCVIDMHNPAGRRVLHEADSQRFPYPVCP
jgi:hypothetical protein